jgi:hypothetical protein
VDIQVNPRWDKATVSVKGKVDAYPAFEMYARLRDRKKIGAAAFLCRIPPEDGATPFSLVGPANRRFHQKAELTTP